MRSVLALLLLGCTFEDPRLRPPEASADADRVTIERAGITLRVARGIGGHRYEGARLAEVRACDGEWEHEYARVANAAVPFEALELHVGGEPFCGGVAWDDVHMRVYALDVPLREAVRAIREGANAEIARLPGARGQVPPPDEGDARWAPRTRYPDWQHVSIRFGRSYGDYGGVANMDFFARRMNGHTVVLLFMWAASPVHEGDGRRVDPIESTITSVRSVR